MTSLALDAITYILATLSRVLTPALQRHLMRLCIRLVADMPQLGTTWVVRFREPCASAIKHSAIDADLQQFGRFIRGRGHVQGQPGDPFQYHGVIKRNVFYGTFRRRESHILAGTGTFVLKISPDSRQMTGRCLWYDNTRDDVWSSEYVWTRQG